MYSMVHGCYYAKIIVFLLPDHLIAIMHLKQKKAAAELSEESALIVCLSDYIVLRNTNISGDNYIEWVDKQCELSMTTVQATHCFSFNPLKESRFTKKATC